MPNFPRTLGTRLASAVGILAAIWGFESLADSGHGTVVSVTGDAMLLTPYKGSSTFKDVLPRVIFLGNQYERHTLAADAKILQGYVVQTRSGAEVSISFENGDQIVIPQDTAVEFNVEETTDGQADAYLVFGSLRADVGGNGPRSRLVVRGHSTLNTNIGGAAFLLKDDHLESLVVVCRGSVKVMRSGVEGSEVGLGNTALIDATGHATMTAARAEDCNSFPTQPGSTQVAQEAVVDDFQVIPHYTLRLGVGPLTTSIYGQTPAADVQFLTPPLESIYSALEGQIGLLLSVAPFQMSKTKEEIDYKVTRSVQVLYAAAGYRFDSVLGLEGANARARVGFSAERSFSQAEVDTSVALPEEDVTELLLSPMGTLDIAWSFAQSWGVYAGFSYFNRDTRFIELGFEKYYDVQSSDGR